MAKHDQHMTLADGREALIDYVVESIGSDPSGMFGPPEHYDPGSGPELYVEAASDPESGAPIEIDEAEKERLAGIIAENPDWWMPEPDEPDDWRDD